MRWKFKSNRMNQKPSGEIPEGFLFIERFEFPECMGAVSKSSIGFTIRAEQKGFRNRPIPYSSFIRRKSVNRIEALKRNGHKTVLHVGFPFFWYRRRKCEIFLHGISTIDARLYCNGKNGVWIRTQESRGLTSIYRFELFKGFPDDLTKTNIWGTGTKG